jgi:tetratricopeptide (TPR) repeat protein
MQNTQPKAWMIALGIGLLISGIGMDQSANAKSQVYRAGASYSQGYRDADKVLQTGQYQAAEAKYTSQLKGSPNNIKVRSALATAQAELYKLDAADKNANQVLAKNPKNAMAHLAKGIVYRNRTASLDMTYRSQREQLLEKSARELQMAVRFEPKSADAHNQLGATYRMQGRLAEAKREFEKALDIDPHFAEARLNQGIAMMQEGNIPGAKEEFNQAIRLNSKNYMAHYRLGEALLAEGDAHGALNSLNTALSLNRGNAAIMAKMGDAYQAQGNTAAAIANYRKAIMSNAAYMPAYVAISDIFDNRGDGELAMAELRSALNVNPHYSVAKNRLGRLALTVDKPDQAMNYFKESLKENPNDSEAINGLSQSMTVVAQKQADWANTMGAESDLVNAEKSIQEALRLNPNDMRLHLANLRISQLAGKPAMSEAELNTLANMTPQSESDQMIKGEAYLSLGRYQEADQVFGDLMHRNSGNPDQLLVIGDTLKTNGDLLRAKDAYRMALAAEPGNLKAQRGIDRIEKSEAEADKNLRLAKAINGFGRNKKASSIDSYEETLSQNPRQPVARLELSKLYERTKQYSKAAVSYQYYLQLRPDLPEKERQGYVKRIAHLQELAQKAAVEQQQHEANEPQKPLPSTMTPNFGTPAAVMATPQR